MSEAAGCLTFIHASAVVVGDAGVLIEGAAGAGKSRLAEALVAEATGRGSFARLVGDDRVGLEARGGRLLARPHPRIAGLLERRGEGLVAVPFEPACVLRLAVHLSGPDEPWPERLPEAPPCRRLCGLALPLMHLPAATGAFEHARAVLWRLTAPRL